MVRLDNAVFWACYCYVWDVCVSYWQCACIYTLLKLILSEQNLRIYVKLRPWRRSLLVIAIAQCKCPLIRVVLLIWPFF